MGDLWPAEIVLVRHAESAGNVARDAAEAAQLPMIDIAERDMDVELSACGVEQAEALGAWLRADTTARRPDVVFCSPYRRAERTAEVALEHAAFDVPLLLDERLRERDFGMLDRLTRIGINQQMPEQAAARQRLGKFFYRPPGGESWTDVALRVRSVIDTFAREYTNRRVLVVAHEVVIFIFRYVFEQIRESELLALARSAPLANCSISSFAFDVSCGAMVLRRWNSKEALHELDAPVTHEPGATVGVR